MAERLESADNRTKSRIKVQHKARQQDRQRPAAGQHSPIKSALSEPWCMSQANANLSRVPLLLSSKAGHAYGSLLLHLR